MELKLIFLACSFFLAWLCSSTDCKYIPANQYQSDVGEVEYVTSAPGAPGFQGFPGFGNGGPGGPGDGGVGAVFKDWMNFIQGFFKEGNWNNGGPQNFASFIGNQVSKLIQMLTRDEAYSGKK